MITEIALAEGRAMIRLEAENEEEEKLLACLERKTVVTANIHRTGYHYDSVGVRSVELTMRAPVKVP